MTLPSGRVNPARAGMILLARSVGPAARSKPRASGDDPAGLHFDGGVRQ